MGCASSKGVTEPTLSKTISDDALPKPDDAEPVDVEEATAPTSAPEANPDAEGAANLDAADDKAGADADATDKTEDEAGPLQLFTKNISGFVKGVLDSITPRQESEVLGPAAAPAAAIPPSVPEETAVDEATPSVEAAAGAVPADARDADPVAAPAPAADAYATSATAPDEAVAATTATVTAPAAAPPTAAIAVAPAAAPVAAAPAPAGEAVVQTL